MVTLRKKARRMGRREVTKLLQAIPKAIAGEGSYKAKTIRTRFFAHLANHFFRRQHEAFVTKSNGDPDEFGNVWKPISESTRIYRPLSAAEKKEYKVGRTSGRGLLTAEENKRWKRYFAQSFHQFSFWMSDKEAKSRAGTIAWAKLKEEGARVKKDLFRTRKGTILVRSGRLLKSFEPSSIDAGYYRPNKEQIAEYNGSQVTFGTKVPYASLVDKTRPLFPQSHQYARWVNEGVQKAVRDMMVEFVSNIQ